MARRLTRVLLVVFFAVPIVRAAVPLVPTPTTTIACPAGATLNIDVIPSHLPPNWFSTATGPMTFVKAEVGILNGKQVLVCKYAAPMFCPVPLTGLAAQVPLASCTVAADGRGFTCKLGTALGK